MGDETITVATVTLQMKLELKWEILRMGLLPQD